MNRPNSGRLPTRLTKEDKLSPRRSPRRVLIVAVPPVRMLDMFGPLEVFRDANRSGVPGRFTKSTSSLIPCLSNRRRGDLLEFFQQVESSCLYSSR